MAREVARRRGAEKTSLPPWIRPQLTQLVKEPPDGAGWLHEIKFDGYRIHARLDRGAARLLTRTGLDWTHKYPAIAAALAQLAVETGLSRRRAVRRTARRHHLVQPDPERFGQRQQRCSGVFPVRSPPPRW